ASVFTHEGDVGPTHRIGIAAQREAHVSDKDRARTGQVAVLVQPEREVCRNVPVPTAWRLVDDETTAHQLGALVRDIRVQQLFSRHELGHVGNVSVLGGHRQAIYWARSTGRQMKTASRNRLAARGGTAGFEPATP